MVVWGLFKLAYAVIMQYFDDNKINMVYIFHTAIPKIAIYRQTIVFNQ